LKWDARSVKAFVVCHLDNALLALLPNNDASVSPGKVVLFPEAIKRKAECVDGKCNDVDDHPANVLPLPLNDKDYCLQTIHGGQHDDGDNWELTSVRGRTIDQITEICASCWKDDCTEEVDEYDEPHTETAETAHVFEPDQLI
jgi:hypothetical protein